MKKIFFNTAMLIRPIVIVGLVFFLWGLTFEIKAQEDDVFPVPESYKVEGIPAIRNSDVEKLFYDPSSIRSNLIWDADVKNRRLLVTDATNNIYLLNAPLAQPERLLEKIVPYSVKTNPNGESFAYTSDHENQDNYQLYIYDYSQKAARKLITLTGKDESIDSFVWSRRGDFILYVRVDYVSKTSKLCQINLIDEKCYPTDFKGVWDVIQEDGNKVLLKYFKASTSQYLYIYDLSTNKLTPIDEKGNSRKANIVNGTVLWTSEGNEKCQKDPCVLSLNLKKNELISLKLPERLSGIYDLKVSPEGSNLLIQETKDGIDDLSVFRLKNGKVLKEISAFITGSFGIWNTRWLSDREVVYTLENIGKPASIRSFNTDSKKMTEWTKERVPSQLDNKVKSTEAFKWRSFDQQEISGYIVRPQKADTKSPVLIFVHGGPQVIDRPVFNSQDIRLASNLGLTIIHTNIRGSSGFGKAFMDQDNGEKRGNAVKDVRALLDWIEKQEELNGKQIYLRGESYGGFIVLATALQEPSRIKGVIAEYPLTSIRGMLSQSWIDETAKNEYGDPKDENLMKKLDELSPLNNVHRWNKIPLFMTRGKLDERNPEKDVTDLKTQLQKSGSEVWFIYSANSGHGFGGKYVFGAMYEFLKQQLKKEK